MIITGNILKLARIIYGIHSQQEMGEILNVSLGTIQRYEAMDEIDWKIQHVYTVDAKFDLEGIGHAVRAFRVNRDIRFNKGVQGVIVDDKLSPATIGGG